MIGLDASLHSVMLQSWFLHTLDFLILPSPIHVPLVIGMMLALVMFLAITYSGQIGWDEPCSVQNRTICCDMELHPANRLDPEGLTIGPLMEGIQISKVPAGLLPPGSGADLLKGSAYSYWHGIGRGDLLQELQQSKSLVKSA
ncbi:hypothetical protein VNO77_27970 [Canavalia gladiata]|uniref:Uncharacterized protein n=1 Tax=Canavalia gladiata TaxID=3824 RepID=A0AAN9KVP2_CANGL